MGAEARAPPERYSMSSKVLDRAPGQDWIAIVRKNGTNEFATAFVAQPVLYASVLNAPCIGVDRRVLRCYQRDVRQHRLHSRNERRFKDLS